MGKTRKKTKVITHFKWVSNIVVLGLLSLLSFIVLPLAWLLRGFPLNLFWIFLELFQKQWRFIHALTIQIFLVLLKRICGRGLFLSPDPCAVGNDAAGAAGQGAAGRLAGCGARMRDRADGLARPAIVAGGQG